MRNKKMNTELQVIENAAKVLSASGDSYIAYITAELQPFSNQQRPDLIYTSKDPSMTFFIEYKFLPPNGISESYINSIDDRTEYVRSGLKGESVTYILAVDSTLSDTDKITLGKHGVKVMEHINSAENLAESIKNEVKIHQKNNH